MQEETVQQKPWAFEVDIKKPDPLSPQKTEAMRQKLEEQSKKHHPMSEKLSDSVLRMVIQMKQLSAERKREFYLNLIKEKAGEDVRHAREVAKKMKESLVSDIKRAKEVLNKQQQLAATVRENIILERKQKLQSNVVHSKEVHDKQLEELEERKKRLAKTIELEQEAAELHRDAIRTYTTLECQLHNDHVNQIVQDHKKDQEFVKTVLETTSKYHEALAQRLHNQSLALKQEKAHKEIEHAQEVSEKHKKELQEREEEEKEWESLTQEIQNANEEYAEFVTQTHKVVDELLNEHTKELLDFTYEPREEKLTNE